MKSMKTMNEETVESQVNLMSARRKQSPVGGADFKYTYIQGLMDGLPDYRFCMYIIVGLSSQM